MGSSGPCLAVTAPATSTPVATSPTPAAWRRTTSPSGTAALGPPWAAVRMAAIRMSQPWRWTVPATSTPGVSSLSWRRGGEQHRQVGRQRLVCAVGNGVTDGRHALAADGAGNLYAGAGSPRRRRGGEQRRQVGWQHLVCAGQWANRCGLSDHVFMPWRWTAPVTSTPGASSPRPAAWQRTTSPSGTAAPGRLGQWSVGTIQVNALAVDGAGNLYAGGCFTTAGGVAANNVAKWDGSAWSALGSGIADAITRTTPQYLCPGGG